MEKFILFGVVLLILSLIPLGIKRLLGIRKTKTSWFYYLVNSTAILLFLALIFEFILNLDNQHLIGYKTRNVIFIGFTFSFIIHYWMTNYSIKLYKIFVELLLTSAVFITLVVSSINLSNYNQFLLYQDNTYRIEKNWELTGINSSLPKLYRKEGIIENRYQLEYNKGFRYDYFHELEKEEIEEYLISETDSAIRVKFLFQDGYSVKTIANK